MGILPIGFRIESLDCASGELGQSRQTLRRILSRQLSVSIETALRLGKWCGNGPVVWAQLQQTCDLWHAERAMAAVQEAVPSRMAA